MAHRASSGLPLFLAPAAVIALAAAGCAHTVIRASEDDASIHINGQDAGKGQAQVRQRGGPGAVHVVVEAPDGRKATQLLERAFRPKLGFILLWGWAYPEEVVVTLPPVPERSGWGKGEDPWSRPPEGFREKADAERATSTEWGDPDAPREAAPVRPKNQPEQPAGEEPPAPDHNQRPPPGDSAWEQPPAKPRR